MQSVPTGWDRRRRYPPGTGALRLGGAAPGSAAINGLSRGIGGSVDALLGKAVPVVLNRRQPQCSAAVFTGASHSAVRSASRRVSVIEAPAMSREVQ